MATYKPKKKTANGLEDILIPYSCIAGTPTIPTVTSTTVTDGTNTLDISGKQDTLTTSNNVTISNNVISALKYYKKADVTGVAGTSSTQLSTTYTVTDNTVTSYYDGMMVTFVLPVAGIGTYGSVFRINSLDYKPIVFNVNSIISTRYSVGSQITMVYNSIQTATAYLTKNVASTITGCWQIMDYDATTTDARRLYDYYFRPYVGANKLYRYKLCALDKDNRLNPITITNQESATQVAKTPTSVPLKIDSIWFYYSTSAINAGSAVTAKVLTSQGYFDNVCPYNFNASIPSYRMIYLRGTYDHTTGLFTLYKDSSSPCTSYYTAVPCNTANITLSSYFTSGYYYWLVGATYGTADYLQLFAYNPLYYFDGTNLVDYTKPAIPSVNDGTLTIQKNGTNVATFSANQSGNVTANISVPSVENTVTSTSTANALSANMGKELQTQISNLQNIGRFLAIWDASTGTPTSEPTVSPYTYKVGDYYRVGVAGTKNPATNLTYVIGGTNYVEGGSLSIGDVVYCSNVTSTATTWAKQASTGGGTVQDVQVNGTSVLSGGIANVTVPTNYLVKNGTTTTTATSQINSSVPNALTLKRTIAGSGIFIDYRYSNQDTNYPRVGAFANGDFGVCNDGQDTVSLKVTRNREIKKDNTYTYTLPNKTGTVALTSDIPSTSSFVPTSRTIAGVDLTDNITASELQTALSVPTTYVSSVNGNSGAITGIANDSSVVHLANAETISGSKTFSTTTTQKISTSEDLVFSHKTDAINDTTKNLYYHITCKDSNNVQVGYMGLWHNNDQNVFHTSIKVPNETRDYVLEYNSGDASRIGYPALIGYDANFSGTSYPPDLGSSTYYWNNLYLNGNAKILGNLTDGTNSISVANIANKNNLATVATSGSYNDLSNKPTIPSAVTSVNGLSGGTITSGTTVSGTMTATTLQATNGLTVLGGAFQISDGTNIGMEIGRTNATAGQYTPYFDFHTGDTSNDYDARLIVTGGTAGTKGQGNVEFKCANFTAPKFTKSGGTSSQFLKADGSVDTTSYVPKTAFSLSGTTLTITNT